MDEVGTVGYMAPEVIRYEEATFRSDIFSAGVVIYLLFSGEHPFGEEHTAEFTKYQTACVEADVQSGLFESASVAFRRLLEQVLQKDPTERPTAEEALQDEWFGAVGKHVSGKASVPLSTPSRATRSESLNLPEEGKRRSWPLTSILSSSRWRRASALVQKFSVPSLRKPEEETWHNVAPQASSSGRTSRLRSWLARRETRSSTTCHWCSP